MLQVGVLGAGFMGATHARAFAALPGVRLAGIAAATPARAAALAHELGAEPTTDALALATSAQIDALSITLPTDLHLQYALAALRAGKHVLLEKPMGLTLAECDAMIAAARTSRTLLMVAHVLRFWPEYQALAEVVRGGELGAPIAASATRLVERQPAGSWFTDPARSGGALFDLQIHDLDLFNWLFGTPQRVFACGRRGPGGGWDHTFTSVDYGGIVASAEGSALMPAGFPFTMALRVVCERGVVEFSSRAAGRQVDSLHAAGTHLTVFADGQAPRALAYTPGDAYQREVAAFVAGIGAAAAPALGTPEQARLAVQLALAARHSLESGQPVSL